MSYLVAMRRVIPKAELLKVVANDESLKIARADDETLDLLWSDGEAEGVFLFAQGELQATTLQRPLG